MCVVLRNTGSYFTSKSGVHVECEVDRVEGSIHQDKRGYAKVTTILKSSLLNEIKFISHIICPVSVGRSLCSK